MYLIALCDDETEELNKAENMLDIYRKKHSGRGRDILVKCFESVDELLEVIREEDYVPDRRGPVSGETDIGKGIISRTGQAVKGY